MRHTTRTTVHTLLVRGQSTFLMRRINSTSFDGMWTAPGGHIEPGEAVLDAAVREAFEEAGVVLDPQHLVAARDEQRDFETAQYRDYFMICWRWGGEPHIREKDMFDAARWFTFEDLPTPCVPGIARTLHERATWPSTRP